MINRFNTIDNVIVFMPLSGMFMEPLRRLAQRSSSSSLSMNVGMGRIKKNGNNEVQELMSKILFSVIPNSNQTGYNQCDSYIYNKKVQKNCLVNLN